jgi:replicative DNA helicase
MLEKVLEDINKKMVNKEQGKFNNIPYDLQKLNSVFPLFVKGMYSCITSNPSVGKTTLLNYLVFTAIRNAINHKIPFKVFWFALEDGADKVISSLISWLLFERFKLRVGFLELNSFTDKPLSRDVQTKIIELQPELKLYLSYLTIDEDNSNPTGMYNVLKKYALEQGHVTMVKKQFGAETRMVFETVPSETTVLVVTDHRMWLL